MNKKTKKIGKKSQKQKFIEILTLLMKDDKYKQIITWDDSGMKIFLIDKYRLSEEVLPKYFKHSNYNSFKRQMNFYDFKQVKDENGALYFSHPSFIKGFVDHENINRRKTQVSEYQQIMMEHNQQKQTLNQLKTQQIEIQQKLIEAISQHQKLQQAIFQYFKQKQQSSQQGKYYFNIYFQTVLKLFAGMSLGSGDGFHQLINYLFPSEQPEIQRTISFVDHLAYTSPINTTPFHNASQQIDEYLNHDQNEFQYDDFQAFWMLDSDFNFN